MVSTNNTTNEPPAQAAEGEVPPNASGAQHAPTQVVATEPAPIPPPVPLPAPALVLATAPAVAAAGEAIMEGPEPRLLSSFLGFPGMR